jgi:hypothetical protein
MEEVPVSSDPRDTSARAEIDRCGRCGGVFLEFFDGEPGALSRGLGAHPDARRDGAERPAGALVCPDGEAPMIDAPYLGHGPAVPRCETCLAVFLSPTQRAALAALRLPPPEEDAEPGWVERLVAWVREL